MKIELFKQKFRTLTFQQKKTAIAEMEKADVSKDHMKGISLCDQNKMEKTFKELIGWCKTQLIVTI